MSAIRRRVVEEHNEQEEEQLRERQLLEQGLEEERGELWEEGDAMAEGVRVGNKKDSDMKKIHKLRKSLLETGIRLVVHLVLLAVYLAVHVHCSDMVKKCPEPARTKIFLSGQPYGGLWKYLTYICMWVVGVHFFLAFFTDVMPISQAKSWFRQFSDWFFVAVAWPLALFVCIFFWAMFLADPHLMRHTVDVAECYPNTLNHAFHTVPLIAVLLECILVYHDYPSHFLACFTVIVWSSSYGIWVLHIFTTTKHWVYPFLAHTNPLTYIISMFVSSLICVAFYYLGKLLAFLIWRERVQSLSMIEQEIHFEEDNK